MVNKSMEQDRVKKIRGRCEATKRHHDLSAWPRHPKTLPLIDLEIDFVRFSTLNHRTKAQQMRKIRETGDQTLFEEDPMGRKAQDAQYEILCSQDDGAFNDLMGNLEERGQQEDAVVTAEGILINGNRRVAALRRLLDDTKDAKKFGYVRCLVLPEDAEPDEILNLETELQVAQRFEKDYTWVNTALLIEELYQKNNRDFKQVANLMHRKKDEIELFYNKLLLVRQIVELSQEKIMYDDFESRESVFTELAKHIRSKNESEKEAVRSVYFLGAAFKTKYRDLRHLRRPDAAKLVADELTSNDTLTEIVDVEHTGGDDASFDEATEKVYNLFKFASQYGPGDEVQLPSGKQLSYEDLVGEIESSMDDAVEEAKTRGRDDKDVQTPINSLEQACKKIKTAHNSLDKARNVPGWNEDEFRKKVEKLESHVSGLKEKL